MPVTASARQETNASSDSIQLQVKSLQSEILELEQYASALENQQKLLGGTLSELEGVVENLKKSKLDLDEKEQEQDTLIQNESLKADSTLSDALNRMMDILSDIEEDSQKASPYFLFQASKDLEQVQEAENAYFSELKQVCQRYFTLPTNSDRSPDAQNEFLSSELERLTDVYPLTRKQYFEAAVENKLLTARLQALEEEYARVEAGGGFEMEYLRGQTNEFQGIIDHSKNEIAKLSDSESTTLLLEELADLEIRMPVLRADYANKEEEIEQNAKKMNEVLELLLAQNAREQFLKLAFEVDLDRQRHLRRWIFAYRDELNTQKESVDTRLNIAKDERLTEALERKTIGHHDSMLLHIKKILDLNISENISKRDSAIMPALFTTYESLIQRVTELSSREKQLSNDLSKQFKEWMENIKQSQNTEQALVNTLCRHPGSSLENLLLSPKELTDLQGTLSEHVKQLQPKIRELTQASAPTSVLERRRELFHAFYLDPEKFRRMISSESLYQP
ncbi:uncharacterized protein VTP21DRAFT_6448 [Calcarisporiella thermophila]|uniref:uncharacterized protein n=1 Tax=Calcarisporiella thermophila TaxID=911321 RepID=UPI0037430884